MSRATTSLLKTNSSRQQVSAGGARSQPPYPHAGTLRSTSLPSCIADADAGNEHRRRNEHCAKVFAGHASDNEHPSNAFSWSERKDQTPFCAEGIEPNIQRSCGPSIHVNDVGNWKWPR